MPPRQQPFVPADVRRERALRRLGINEPKCRSCTECHPDALTGVAPEIVCYACLAQLEGRALIEDHHPAGRHNDPVTVPAPANDHRILNVLQEEWPTMTLRNPDGSPLLAAAAAIRGWLDILRLIIDRAVGWVPEFLEWLDSALRASVGECWWENLGWEGRP
jgi:hypothetical protein